MEALTQKIKAFLSTGSGSGFGYGFGYGSGYGSGSGSGDGDGSGFGSGYGDGYGYGSGFGYGSGYGSGSGDGDGFGFGYGYGDGSGYGYGSGDGYGYGSGDGDIKEFDGHQVYDIDGVPTCIEHVNGRYAIGFTFPCFVKTRCFIAKVDGHFGHGENLHKAFDAAYAKAMEDKPLEDRIVETVKQFPDPKTPIQNDTLFTLHHVLTGSCEFGRRQFCEQRGISLDGTMTMEDFIATTINAYGGGAIRQLAEAYGIKINTNQ